MLKNVTIFVCASVCFSSPAQESNLPVRPALPSSNAAARSLNGGQRPLWVDSDMDGLPDEFEVQTSHTNPRLWDSDGNGISDADELSPSGLPWCLVLAQQRSEVIVFADATNAVPHERCGRFTILLPKPAPAGGTTVEFYLRGLGAPGIDYSVTPTNNSLTIREGAYSGTINVCAIPTTAFAPGDRYLTVRLYKASNFKVDETPARVNIVNTNPPGIRVFALPRMVDSPSPAYGTNAAEFSFMRDGRATNASTVTFSLSGSAVSGQDYVPLPRSVTFPAGLNSYDLPVTLLRNPALSSNRTLTLKIIRAPGYQIDPVGEANTLSIIAHPLPRLPVVQITASEASTPTSNPAFTITRTGLADSPLRVFYLTRGTAAYYYTNPINGQVTGDYDPPYHSYVDFSPGATAVTASICAVASNGPVMKTITLNIAQASEYIIGSRWSATVRIWRAR